MFLQTVSSLGYSDSGKIKRDIERLCKNAIIKELLDDFASNVSSANLVTSNQWEKYQTLLTNSNTLEAKDVKKTLRFEQNEKTRLARKLNFATQDLNNAQMRIKFLERQLQNLDSTFNSGSAYEENMHSVIKSTALLLQKSKSEDKEAQSKFSRSVSQINDDCNTVCNDYENPEKKSQLFLSGVDLDTYFLSEEEYTLQLKQYAKKQFQGVQNSVSRLSCESCEINNLTDTVLLQDESDEVKQKLVDDVQRATLGYGNRKMRSILAKAKKEKNTAICHFAQNRLSSLKHSKASQHQRDLDTLRLSNESIKQQISYTESSVLPEIISKGIPIQRSHILTADFRKKLTEQRHITNKQKRLIDFLILQCSRFSLVWMMLLLEKSQAVTSSKNLSNAFKIMKDNLEESIRSTKLLSAARHVDTQSREPKAVIDKRDTVMLALHKALVSETPRNSMFQTFESVYGAASSLDGYLRKSGLPSCSTKHDNAHLESLSTALLQFYWEHSDAASKMENILLSPEEISEKLISLQNAVSNAKVSVPKLISKVDKKRSFLEHNEQAIAARNFWVDFVLQLSNTG